MKEKKIKIQELADELKVDHQAAVNTAREAGINAKNASTALSAEEAEKLRKRLAKPADHKDVIVRRRKPGARPEKVENAPKAEAEKQATEKPVEKVQRQAEKPAAPKVKIIEPVKAKIISRPADQAKVEQAKAEQPKTEQASAVQPKAEQAQREAAPVQTSDVQAKPVEASEPQAQKKPEAAATSQPEQVKKPQPEAAKDASRRPAQGTESKPARAEQPKDAAKDAKAKEKKPQASAAPFETPKVRIISRPAPAPARPQQQRNERDGERRGGGRGRDGRDGRDNTRDNDRQQRTPRDAGGRSDDNRQRRSGGGQGRPGGARPQGGAPRAGDMMGFGPADNDSRSGQSKKKRNKGRRTVDFQQMGFDAHDENEAPRMRSTRSRKKKQVQAPAQVTQPLKAAKRKVRVEGGTIRVSDMAHQMGLKANELIKVLFNLGIMATINQSIDFDTASILASEFSYEVERTGFEEKDYLEDSTPDRPEDLKPRPPVVTIMGHVDHGKTSLLDAIRKTHVTSGEAGGITQHIGAYHVNTKNGDVVFLDTPGHEAFTAMRARGAQITDLVILVVAADDGVMEQTREAINHARAAEVPIIVAVNKIDKPGADPDRVLTELSTLGLQPEEWGGDTIVAKVSAKTHQGLDELLELVALQSEVMELKANPDKPARGHIIEAKLDKGRGPVATVLIQEGTLHQGDNFVCGTFSGRVRALLNDQGKKVREAGPSIPVEVQGFTGVPDAGEVFASVADEKVARRIADARAVLQREKELASETKVTLETFLASTAGEEKKTLNLVVKADVQGSLEAVQDAMRKAGTDKVSVNVVHGATGAISESDIMLASASQAIIIGFNVRPTARIKDIAAHENVDIRFYDIIYKLVDDVKSAMAGLLAPVEKEVYLGQAEVRQTFSLPKVGTIAGSYVADGKVSRNAQVRLLRDGVVVYTGRISSLKRFKDDAREVLRGNECGIGLDKFNDIKAGDIIEAFETVQEAATL